MQIQNPRCNDSFTQNDMEADVSSNCLLQIQNSIQIQNPPKGSFSQNDLEWTVRKAIGDPAEFCYILTTRLSDFIEGEMKNVHSPTSFYKKVCKTRKLGSLSKPDMNSHLNSTMYWCSYGPQDLSEDQHLIEMPSKGKGKRKIKWSRGVDAVDGQQPNAVDANEQQPKPIENTNSRKRSRKKKKALEGEDHAQMEIQQPVVRRKRRLRGETYKRGCMCHFLAKQLYIKPEWTQIIYYQRKHVNIHGAACHGNAHEGSLGTRYQLAPWLSKEKKEWVKSLLMDGHSCREVMKLHEHQVVHKLQMYGEESKDRDDFLEMDDIGNIFDEVSRGAWKRHNNVTQEREILAACGTMMGTMKGGLENLEFHEDVANMNGCEEVIEEVGCPLERVNLEGEVDSMKEKTYAENQSWLLASIEGSIRHVKSTIEECPGLLHHVDFLMKEVCNKIHLLKNTSHEMGINVIPPPMAEGKDDGTGNSLTQLRSYIDLTIHYESTFEIDMHKHLQDE